MAEAVILLASVNILGYWTFRNAERMRVQQLRMRREEPVKFIFFGFSKQFLDDPKMWVRRYRIFVVMFAVYGNLFLLWFFLDNF